MSTWILTATNRLSQALREQQQHPNASLILPLNAWLTRVFEYNAEDTRQLLTTAQAIYLWQQIIREDNQHLMMRDADVASDAYQAWCLLQQWNLCIDELRNEPCADVQTFYAWANKFEKRCKHDALINHCELGSWVIDHLPKLPDKICFLGFDEFTPQIERLMESLREHVTLENPSSLPPLPKGEGNPERKHLITKVTAKNTLDEIQLMARAAKHWHLENPLASIACVVPELTEQRENINRIFNAYDLFFSISLGQPLSSFPIINTAFEIFELVNDQISYNTISTLLHSPYIKGGQLEYCQRAMLDKKLREKVLPHILVSLTLPMARNHQRFCYAPNWVESVEKFQNIMKQNNADSAYSFAQLFSDILSAFGWPGDRKLNSEEFQLVNRFHELLDEFIQFDQLHFSSGLQDAVSLLKQLAMNTVFQAKTEKAPIQILGTLEAAGLHFDHVWVMGLSSNAWPQATKPNPFLPFKLQRKYNMPHASAVRELEFTRTVTTRLLHSAPDVIVSYPTQQEDVPCSPSSLIHSTPVSTFDFPELQNTLHEVFLSQQLEKLPDHKGPALSKYKMSLGGSQIFKSQSHCAFQAFAKLRLQAQGIVEPSYGLSPAERGEIVHHALAYCWHQLKTSAALHALSENELSTLIESAIDDALVKQHHSKRIALFSIEKTRLKKILYRWFEYEKTRDPFEVHALETSFTSKLFDLNLKIRIDRVDQLDDGSYVIIDYKTGRTQLSDILSDPLLEPQLPLYLATYDEPTCGAIFAEVRADSLRFKGVVAENGCLPDTKVVDWERTTQQWWHQLLALSKAYRSGVANVAPQSEKSCLYCDLHSLCRIHEEEIA